MHEIPLVILTDYCFSRKICFLVTFLLVVKFQLQAIPLVQLLFVHSRPSHLLRLFHDGRPMFLMRITLVGTGKSVVASLPQAIPLVASIAPFLLGSFIINTWFRSKWDGLKIGSICLVCCCDKISVPVFYSHHRKRGLWC